jgi:hypothetical protein
MAAITTRPMGSGSVTNYFTGGMDLSQFGRPSTDASNYKSQASKDAWNNYSAAQGVRESLTPGSMGYGRISRLPNESWNDWQSRSSAASDMFGGGLSGSYGLSNALRREQGLSSGGSRMSSGGGGGGGGGGAISMGQPAPIEFYLGPAPTLEELNLNYEEMGKRAMEANAPFAAQYKQFAPQTEAGTRALSQAGATMATGQLSRDMVGDIGRGAAALGFSSGLGGRSGIGRNILARDLGLGSLQVQQQGADLLSKSSMLAQQAMQAMTPIAVGSVFDTAANQASVNQQIRNQNLFNKYQTQGLPGQFDVTKGQYVGYKPGTYSPTKPLTPDAEAAAALSNRAEELNSRSPGRFRVSGGKILDSYNGRFV